MNSVENKKFQEIWDEANAAGEAAADECYVQHIRAQDTYTGKVYPPFPICGFAWVNIKPATIKFCRWLKEYNLARTDSYEGGVTIWISQYDQSYDRKLAHAQGMARVFKEHGFNARAQGRLD